MEHQRLCSLGILRLYVVPHRFKSVRFKRVWGDARQSARIWHKKNSIHALWLHPAALFGIHFGFLSVAMVTSGTGGAPTKCLHWMTAAEARAAWNGVFSKGDRVVPERPARTRGAQKSTSTSWKCHAPGKWGLPLEPMLFLRTAFINVAPLHVAFTPSGLTRSQGARSMD